MTCSIGAKHKALEVNNLIVQYIGIKELLESLTLGSICIHLKDTRSPFGIRLKPSKGCCFDASNKEPAVVQRMWNT